MGQNCEAVSLIHQNLDHVSSSIRELVILWFPLLLDLVDWTVTPMHHPGAHAILKSHLVDKLDTFYFKLD